MRTARYQDSVSMRGEADPEISRFTAFNEAGPDPLADVQSLFESAVVGDKPDPSTWGLVRAIGGAMLTGTSSPIASITDQYQVAKIRELQKTFLEANNESLLKLGDYLGKAKRAMRELAEQMGANPLNPMPLRDLLAKKRRLGDASLRDIDAALEHASDSAEAARLRAMRDDLTSWMAERDARTEAEQGEVGALIGRIQGLETQMMRQRGILEQAAASEGPRNLTNDGRVVETSHHRPDAAMHAASLQDMLLGSKAGIDSMLRGD
jgi:hypothetical protein